MHLYLLLYLCHSKKYHAEKSIDSTYFVMGSSTNLYSSEILVKTKYIEAIEFLLIICVTSQLAERR